MSTFDKVKYFFLSLVWRVVFFSEYKERLDFKEYEDRVEASRNSVFALSGSDSGYFFGRILEAHKMEMVFGRGDGEKVPFTRVYDDGQVDGQFCATKVMKEVPQGWVAIRDSSQFGGWRLLNLRDNQVDQALFREFVRNPSNICGAGLFFKLIVFLVLQLALWIGLFVSMYQSTHSVLSLSFWGQPAVSGLSWALLLLSGVSWVILSEVLRVARFDTALGTEARYTALSKSMDLLEQMETELVSERQEALVKIDETRNNSSLDYQTMSAGLIQTLTIEEAKSSLREDFLNMARVVYEGHTDEVETQGMLNVMVESGLLPKELSSYEYYLEMREKHEEHGESLKGLKNLLEGLEKFSNLQGEICDLELALKERSFELEMDWVEKTKESISAVLSLFDKAVFSLKEYPDLSKAMKESANGLGEVVIKAEDMEESDDLFCRLRAEVKKRRSEFEETKVDLLDRVSSLDNVFSEGEEGCKEEECEKEEDC